MKKLKSKMFTENWPYPQEKNEFRHIFEYSGINSGNTEYGGISSLGVIDHYNNDKKTNCAKIFIMSGTEHGSGGSTISSMFSCNKERAKLLSDWFLELSKRLKK